jgi:hypothetical protein
MTFTQSDCRLNGCSQNDCRQMTVDKMTRQNDCRQMTVDKMTIDKMIANKMTKDKIIANKITTK